MSLFPCKAPLPERSSEGRVPPVSGLARRASLSVASIRGADIRAAILILIMGLAAGSASVARDLDDPELVYTYLSRAFPGTVKDAGGLSSEISLVELVCYFSNTREGGRVGLEAGCRARTAAEEVTLSATGDVKDLILGLINAGLPLERQAEAGTTYLVARSLECARLECKSPDPAECAGVEISYECSTD